MKRGKRIDLTQAQLITILQQWIAEHHKLPSTAEWASDPTHPSYQTYMRRFGMSWERILASLNAADSFENEHYRYKNLTDEEVNRQFNSDINRIANSIDGPVLKKYYDQLRSCHSLTSQSVMKHLHKTWSELLTSAGLPPDRISRPNRGAKRAE